VAKGENLVRTRLDFAYFCAYLLWYCLTSCVAKGENLAQAWLDFAYFCVFLLLGSSISQWLMGVAKTKPRSELAWFCLIFAISCIGCLVIVSYGGVAYRILIVVSCCRIGRLAIVWCPYCSLVLSCWLCFYGSPLLLCWLSCYGIVVPVRETRHRENTFIAETARKLTEPSGVF
jgi:hypothetical protein